MFAIHSLIRVVYKNCIRSILFKIDAESVHDKVIKSGKLLGDNPFIKKRLKHFLRYDNPKLEQKILGIKFKNPIGLSAGFDKDANLVDILYNIGFGFMQVGSITLKPYEGNPKPRLYRLIKSKGIVVYYGLKNIGVDKIIKKLKFRKDENFPVSVSIAKTNCESTKDTKDGIEDYYQCLKKVVEANVGDFYTINISCPNTFGGEPFTTPDKLNRLLNKLSELKIHKPIFVKMPIDIEWQEFKKLLDVIVKFKLNGVIVGNLTKKRNSKLIKDEIPETIKGGISGKPTWNLTNNLISKTYNTYGDQLVVIGVGGVFSARDAYEKIKRGASLVQLITGMVYNGPQLIGEINRELVQLLEKDGFKSIQEAVGS